jgi:hypothetical protein
MDYTHWRECMEAPQGFLRPAEVCKALLNALEASEGRRKRRKRDQTPDAIGLAVKRHLLESAVRDNPDPETFEAWLFQYSENKKNGQLAGAVTAMARLVLEEWRLAHSLGDFKAWLDRGAPSEDAEAGIAVARN